MNLKALLVITEDSLEDFKYFYLGQFHTARIHHHFNDAVFPRPHNHPPLTFGTWFAPSSPTILSHLDRGEEDAKLSILECARVR